MIDFNPHSYMNTSDYQIVTVKQAKLNDWVIEPIYISDHIRSIVTGVSSTEPTLKRKWGAKPSKTEEVEVKAEKPKPKQRRRTSKKKTETPESQSE
jgi:hypothetical protein